MRRISLWMLSTVAALVLLFSYRTSTGPSPAPATVAATPAGEGQSFSGEVARTQEGDVQVVITVAGGRITSVAVPVYPTGSQRHDEISARAVPELVAATLAAQSADVDSVSGATYTSGGYRESLQSAIDAAGL
ncbi:FMN-binding protein [Actinoplanes xinjiangensis]|uniref:FMN-binding protein n=1 Tax=Actinoplanes xinjiangensis TaxID=512350 RepID=A0A316FVF8_9ACTN|nr:FMN-binding protein [Actinoplanes xinjiangensis]PWK52302.1 FMN-binding protein [Actinoplanes xinjiangensis]GIF36997.1 FMN-binding protein [Actinoplanes xinjiangensis]